MDKIDINSLININFYNKFDYIKTIHEVSNKNVAILLCKKLIIISYKTFKTIEIIEPKYQELNSNKTIIGNEFVDFIEINNSDIVLWTSNVILIYDKKYNLIQKIDEMEYENLCKREDYDYDTAIFII